VAQKEGLPGIFYERPYGEHSRVYGFAKVLLMTGDSHEVTQNLARAHSSTDFVPSGLLSDRHDGWMRERCFLTF
jgi:hypothetical protein